MGVALLTKLTSQKHGKPCGERQKVDKTEEVGAGRKQQKREAEDVKCNNCKETVEKKRESYTLCSPWGSQEMTAWENNSCP